MDQPLEKYSEPTCLFDGNQGHVNNSVRIQHLARQWGWKLQDLETVSQDDGDQLNHDTDEALEYLNQHAVAEGFEIAWHDGDVLVLSLDDDAG